VAARLQPVAPFQRRRLVVGVVALVALGLPVGAHAHGTRSVNALDFEARITATAPRTSSIQATVVDGDRKLALRVKGSHDVVVLGYAGEPFLRFSAAGVEVNERSPTAIIVKLAKRGSDPALSAGAPTKWSSLSPSHRYAWHDHRLGPKPGVAYGEGDVGGWAIPIVIDGKTGRVAGRLWHARGPPFWPWLVLLGATIAVAIVVARRRNHGLAELGAIAAAVSASAAALLLSIVLGFAPGSSATAAWGNAAFSALLALAAIPILVLARQARRPVAGVVGMFAALSGLGHLSVFAHGYVIALVSATVVRAVTAASVCFGLIAVVSGLMSFFDIDCSDATSRGPNRRAAAVAREKGRSR
jgi:hypothetical protein